MTFKTGFVFAAAVSLLLASITVAAAARPPNFVLFLADDMGFGDVGCFGHPTILTPSIDALAHSGMKFTQFYSAYPICTPSRSGLLTARLPVRNGIYSNASVPLDMIFRVFLPNALGGLPAKETTIPQVLKTAGYNSALIGKWHLGHVDCLPTQRGFDEFYGLPYAQDEGCPPKCPFPPWPGVPLYDNMTIIEQPVDLSTLTPRYNQKAFEFIDKNKDNPFFLMMSYDEVHVPLFASNAYLNKSARGFFGDAMEEMDGSIGAIMQKLQDSKLLDNTLVIFSSDNGAWTEKELDGGSNGLLRGQKGETWEGGMRVPTIFSWPGVIPSGTTSLALGSLMDLLPTFAELASVPTPNKTLDGHSLVPVITGKNYTNSSRETIFYYRTHVIMAVRYGQYKAHYYTRSGWGLDGYEKHDPPILFHLEHDPSELYPLDPDDYKDLLSQFDVIVKKHKESIGPLPPAQLDEIDWSNKVVPCCDKQTNCTCKAGGVTLPYFDQLNIG